MPNGTPPPYEHELVQGDSAPSITETLLDGDGVAVNLTGATVNWVLRPEHSDAPSVNTAATIVTPASGIVRITPTTVHTQDWGSFLEVWRVTFGGGAIETFPASHAHRVRIRKGTHSSP